MQNLIDDFTAALDAHTLEYNRRNELWKQRNLDIMDLGCREQNERIAEMRRALERVLPPWSGRCGNDAVLKAAREYLAPT